MDGFTSDNLAGITVLVMSVLTIVNLATRHYSELDDGPWWSKAVRALLWAIERASPIGTDGRIKIPGTERKPKRTDGGQTVVAMLPILAALAALALWLGGCGATLSTVKAAQGASEIAEPIVRQMCEPVEAACEARRESPCTALGACLRARVVAAKSLIALNDAIRMAAMAAIAGKDADMWMEVVKDAMSVAYGQVEAWR